MSHSEKYTDTGRTTVFYDGMQAGIEKERERILELLEHGTRTRDTLLTFHEAIEESLFDLPDGNRVVERNLIYIAMEQQMDWWLEQIKGEQK